MAEISALPVVERAPQVKQAVRSALSRQPAPCMANSMRNLVSPRHIVFVAAFAALLSLRTNAQVLGFEWFASDDESFVVAPASVESPSLTTQLTTPMLGHPMPATLATYRAAHAVNGSDATIFHALNLGFAVAGAALLAAWIAWLLGATRTAAAASFLGACLFVSHPITAEPVAWIASLKDVAPLPFLLGAALVLVRSDLRSPRACALLALLFTVAMAFKPSSSALLFVVAWVAATRQQFSRTTIALCVYMGALGLITMQVSRAYQSELGLLREVESFGHWLQTIAYVFRVQLVQLLSPYDILLGERRLPTGGQAAFDIGLLASAIVASFAALVDLRRRALRPLTPARLGLVWAIAFYVPVSAALGSSHQVVSDRYMYISLAGISLCLASAAFALAQRIERLRRGDEVVPFMLVVSLSAWLILALFPAHQRTLSRWSASPTYFTALYDRFPPIVGDPWTQSLCVQTGRSYAFRLREYDIDDIDAAIAVLETCDDEVAGPSLQRAREIRARLATPQSN